MGNKAGTCRCGHEIRYWHDPATGQCMVGREWKGHEANAFGSCPCVRKVKAKKMNSTTRTTRAVTIEGEKILNALDNIITGFQVIRAAVARGKDSEGGTIMQGVLRDKSGAEAEPRAPTRTNGTASAVVRTTSNGGAASSRAQSKGPRAILLAIVQSGARGITDAGITVATGYKETSRYTYLNALRGEGAVVSHDGRHFATNEGVHWLGDYERLPTGRALLEYWRERLPPGESVIFKSVRAGSCTMASLVATSGYKETSIYTYLNRLRARELLSYEDGVATISPELGGPS